MGRGIPRSLLIWAVILIVCGFVAIPLYLHAHKISEQNACIKNMGALWSCAHSYCICEGMSCGKTLTLAELTPMWGFVMKEHGKCPSGTAPYAPFNVYEGPVCPNGHQWPGWRKVTPWKGTAEAYIVAMTNQFRPEGMRLGSPALLQMTPELFDDVRVRSVLLENLHRWYEEPWNADLIADLSESLGRIRDPRAVEHLIPGLKCKEWYARMNVAQALGRIGDQRALEPLTALLNDENERVKKAASEALKKIRAGGQ